MKSANILQEYAAEFFAPMSLSDLMHNHPLRTLKAYAEVGDCEENGDSLVEIEWAWEKAMDKKIIEVDQADERWVLFEKEQSGFTYRSYVPSLDVESMRLAKKEGWEMVAMYKNFAAWSEDWAKDVVKGQSIGAYFYAHENMDNYSNITGKYNYYLNDLAAQSGQKADWV